MTIATDSVKSTSSNVGHTRNSIAASKSISLSSNDNGNASVNDSNSSVSSVSTPFTCNDPLIICLGIGEFDNGLPNLPSVSKDYDNIINTYVYKWKYKVFYQLEDNNFVYSNQRDELQRNYKLRWSDDDVDQFLEQARKHIVKNKHNGFMFFLSSHGDRDNVFFCSDLQKYELGSVYMLFTPQWNQLLEGYQESKQESNHLFQIPKLFFLDICRGDTSAKITKITAENGTYDNIDNIDMIDSIVDADIVSLSDNSSVTKTVRFAIFSFVTLLFHSCFVLCFCVL